LLDALFRTLLDRTQSSPHNRWIALFAAALFGLHPAMAETVNYIIQRGDLYCTLGCVAALLLYARYPKLRRTALYLLPLTLALLSKPPAAVFPLLLFFYVWFFEPRPNAPTPKSPHPDPEQREGEGTPYLPLPLPFPLSPPSSSHSSPSFSRDHTHRLRFATIAAIPSAILVTLALWLQSAMTPRTFLPSQLAPSAYRLTQPYVWLRYAGEFFLPIRLNIDSDLTSLRAFDPRAIAGFLFLALLCIAIIFTARRKSTYPISFGLLWFVITQLPTSLYPLSELENDHRMFFSFPGLALAAAWTAYLLVKPLPKIAGRPFLAELHPAINGKPQQPKPPLPTVNFLPDQTPSNLPLTATLALLILAALAFGTYHRNHVWLNEETLWHDDVLKSPHNGRGLMNYGLTQMNKGDYPVALDYFTRALAFTPNYATLEIDLGIAEGALADQSPAAHPRHQAEPHFLRAIALQPNDDDAHTFYGRWLLEHGRSSEGLSQLHIAIALNPNRAMAHDELIQALTAAGDISAALQAARQTLAIIPGDIIAQATLTHPPAPTAAFWINLSLAQYQAANFEAAATSANHALQLDPHSAEAWNNLGAANAGLHRWDDAIAADQHAISLKPTFQLARNNLAWSLQQKSLNHK
jgi:uncharacterized protein (TIGR02996 family)